MSNDYYDYGGDLAVGGVLLIILLICVVLGIVCLVAEWKIFKKAGKPGWHSIIPYLNVYDLYEFTWSKNMGIVAIILVIAESLSSYSLRMSSESDGGSILTTISGLAGFAYFIISIVQQVKLAKSFGRSGAFAVGLIFLSPIFLCILAFGNSVYIGPNGDGTAMSPYGQAPYGQQGYGQVPYSQPPYGQAPYGQQNIPGGYGSAPAPGYDTFTTQGRTAYQGPNGFAAQGQASQNGFAAQGQANQNVYDPQPQQQNPFSSGNPYDN